jgi:hypothetical protein
MECRYPQPLRVGLFDLFAVDIDCEGHTFSTRPQSSKAFQNCAHSNLRGPPTTVMTHFVQISSHLHSALSYSLHLNLRGPPTAVMTHFSTRTEIIQLTRPVETWMQRQSDPFQDSCGATSLHQLSTRLPSGNLQLCLSLSDHLTDDE